jgi:hypothetical protein
VLLTSWTCPDSAYDPSLRHGNRLLSYPFLPQLFRNNLTDALGPLLASVSPTTVLNLETNKEIAPQRRTIRKLAEALGVDPAELVE